MIVLSNPRTKAVIENWPSGRKTVTCTFECETNKRGTRVNRTTTGKPVRSNYYVKAVIVDGDDDRTYILAQTHIGQIVRIPGTMKTGHEYFYEKDDEFGPYQEVLKAA